MDEPVTFLLPLTLTDGWMDSMSGSRGGKHWNRIGMTWSRIIERRVSQNQPSRESKLQRTEETDENGQSVRECPTPADSRKWQSRNSASGVGESRVVEVIVVQLIAQGVKHHFGLVVV